MLSSQGLIHLNFPKQFLLCDMICVTRFGINYTPLWFSKMFKNNWLFRDVWTNFEPYLAFVLFRANLHCLNGQILKNNLTIITLARM